MSQSKRRAVQRLLKSNKPQDEAEVRKMVRAEMRPVSGSDVRRLIDRLRVGGVVSV